MATMDSNVPRARGTANASVAANHVTHERVGLWCGCEMEIRRVSGHARASRLIAHRGRRCSLLTHVVGARVEIWEMLPPAPWRR